MTTLTEACTMLMKATEGTRIEVTFNLEEVTIHWHGVMRLCCQPADAAKAIPLLKKLEELGVVDC